MMANKASTRLQDAIMRLKGLYREKQPTDFIALEFLVSPEILEAVQPNSKLWKALRQGEKGIPKQGFAWLATDNELARIVELTRDRLQRSKDEEADDILLHLLTDPDPDFLKKTTSVR